MRKKWGKVWKIGGKLKMLKKVASVGSSFRVGTARLRRARVWVSSDLRGAQRGAVWKLVRLRICADIRWKNPPETVICVFIFSGFCASCARNPESCCVQLSTCMMNSSKLHLHLQHINPFLNLMLSQHETIILPDDLY